jgi:hypothetical protein
MPRSRTMPRTAFVSTYAPHRCGIATFTFDLASAVGGREIVALYPADAPGPYPPEVHHRIRRDVRADYISTARSLNDCGVEVVSRSVRGPLRRTGRAGAMAPGGRHLRDAVPRTWTRSSQAPSRMPWAPARRSSPRPTHTRWNSWPTAAADSIQLVLPPLSSRAS